MTAASDRGRSSLQRGLVHQRETAADFRQLGFPNAEHCGNKGSRQGGGGDLLHVGDRIVEATVEPMSALAKKLRQAESDAIRCGFGEYWVVKKAAGEKHRRAYLITRTEVGVPLLARLDRLEWWEAEMSGSAQDARDAGYRDGYRDGLAARDGANR